MKIPVHEQIYTSAAALLQGGGNLGVVAQTRSFPADVASDLASLRSYNMLPGLPLDRPEAHPPRFVGGPRQAGAGYSVSRVAFGGFDHTGRTTPLIHHLVATVADARAAGVTPAELVGSLDAMFERQYTPPPRWIDPPRDAGPAAAATPPAALAAVLPAVASAVFAYAADRRPAVVVVDPAWPEAELLGIVRGVLAAVPPSVGWATVWATHVAEAADYVRDAALALTYPGTPFLLQCQGRRDARAPVVVDLTRPAAAPAPPGSWADAWGPHATPEQVTAAGQWWDRAGFDPSRLPAFAAVAAVVRGLDGSAKVGPLTAVPPALSPWVSEAAVRFVARHPAEAVAVATEPTWPVAARSAAVASLVMADPPTALEDLARRGPPPPALAAALREHLSHHPDRSVELFDRHPDAAAYLIDVGPVDAFHAMDMADRVSALPAGPLTAAVVRAVTTNLTTADRLELLRHSVPADADAARRFCRTVAVPALRERLDRPGTLPWPDVYAAFVPAAVRGGDAVAQATWAFGRFAARLGPADVQRWLTEPGVDPAAIVRSADAAGLTRREPPPPAPVVVLGRAVPIEPDPPALDDVGWEPSAAVAPRRVALRWSDRVPFFKINLALLAAAGLGVAAHLVATALRRPSPAAAAEWAVVAAVTAVWAVVRFVPWVGRRLSAAWLPWAMTGALLAAAVLAWWWAMPAAAGGGLR